MPHVIVKLWPGKSKQQIAELTDRIVKDVTTTLLRRIGLGCV